jgi:hypothetical protein
MKIRSWSKTSLWFTVVAMVVGVIFISTSYAQWQPANFIVGKGEQKVTENSISDVSAKVEPSCTPTPTPSRPPAQPPKEEPSYKPEPKEKVPFHETQKAKDRQKG